MTELCLMEMWCYLDARIGLLNDPESIALRTHVRLMWGEHFDYEAKHPNIFPTEQVREVFGTTYMPVHWGSVIASGEEDL